MAYTVAPEVIYSKSADISKETAESCSWTTNLSKAISALGAKPREQATSNLQDVRQVSLTVLEQDAPEVNARRKIAATVRAGIHVGGHLLAIRDFKEDNKISASTKSCDGLNTLVKELAESIDHWARDEELPQCTNDCEGIHPDEPIYTAAVITDEADDAVNDTVRNECKWLDYMPGLIATAYSDDAPPMQPPLIVKENLVRSPSIRTLVLRVNNVHVIGGGGFTGPKWISMQGELHDGALLVGSFKVLQRDKFGGMKACTQLRSMSESLADKIAEWLRNPELDAKL